ncbi:hypothetical protein C7974DRAFT_42780 [Boeremia exigua]|uniref:uncharacterized protein n=1 Tax=Boeremia exigua TaxID=749465 RepID=UPI001E8E9697|nr:uncharacterized protein C7974DRAFT_42780 [Boeremia exigua]KAH6616310.1 hypothetical protein C7974DRAFT_42780 [Boeremia exigua]
MEVCRVLRLVVSVPKCREGASARVARHRVENSIVWLVGMFIASVRESDSAGLLSIGDGGQMQLLPCVSREYPLHTDSGSARSVPLPERSGAVCRPILARINRAHCSITKWGHRVDHGSTSREAKQGHRATGMAVCNGAIKKFQILIEGR